MAHMGINDEPRTEPLVKAPQSIRELYDSFIEGIGKGENPLFSQAPTDAVFKNFVGDEKPLLYIKETDESVKKWLTQDEIQAVQETGNQVKLNDEQLFDMFSFMIGGRSPTLRDLGVGKWTDLLSRNNSESGVVEGLDRVRKIFEFIDTHPNTSLASSLGDVLGLSTNRTQKFEVTNGDKKGLVILMGDTSWNRGKMFVWHPTRNARSVVQPCSPFKSDGSQNIGNINDVQIGYQDTEGPRIVRLNKIVFLMARHGLGEQTGSETALDQIYMPLSEFVEQLYIQDNDTREQQHQLENDNFVINYKLPGSQELVQHRKDGILTKMLEMANNGGLDGVLQSIEHYQP